MYIWWRLVRRVLCGGRYSTDPGSFNPGTSKRWKCTMFDCAGQIELVDCIHERCKRCCIVKYLEISHQQSFVFEPGQAASACVEVAEGVLILEGYSCPFSGNWNLVLRHKSPHTGWFPRRKFHFENLVSEFSLRKFQIGNLVSEIFIRISRSESIIGKISFHKFYIVTV